MTYHTSESTFDLIIVGSGPGGYVAAIRGAQLGLRVAIVESQDVGGVCLNWGCIPTKALLRTSELYHLTQHLAPYGLELEGRVTFDMKKIVQRSRNVAAQLASGIQHLLKKNKIQVIQGHGRLGRKNKDMLLLIVEKSDKTTKTFGAKAIILATGARPRTLKDMEPDNKIFLSW